MARKLSDPRPYVDVQRSLDGVCLVRERGGSENDGSLLREVDELMQTDTLSEQNGVRDIAKETYSSERLERKVVQPVNNGPESRPVEVEGEVVAEPFVDLREEGRHRHASP